MFCVTDTEAVELRPNFTEDDLQIVIRAVYKQVLGNQHILEGDAIEDGESMLRNGDITVRGFVRMVAQSDLYRSLFFESSSPYRFIELNCKHLLGRAPADQAEISEHVQRYITEGYSADIDSYIDSEEYDTKFGENIVPYPCSTSTQTGMKNSAYTRTFALMSGYAGSDRSTAAILTSDLAGNLPTKIDLPADTSGAYDNTGKRFRIQISKGGVTPVMKRSNMTVEVGFSQLTQRIQSIQKTGGTIVDVTEVA
ncbi:MAG: phycobilisome rod-core linker polypeptide [Cyanobacteria bacterium SBLK]|nr:phycobilisome rod-core linker polypeptide [Cyanobacteria bacterium SBLK]